MPRSRARSPSPTAPRRQMHTARPAPPAPRSQLPAHPPPSAPAAPMAQPQQPGMFAQMATTAAGVAVGSAVGHTLSHAMMGGMGGGGASEAAPVDAAAPEPYYQSPAPAPANATGPCAFEIRQFLECAQTQGDLTLCEGFNEAIRQCKTANGMA